MDIPKKLYLHDDGYYSYSTGNKKHENNFKNVCITENSNSEAEHTDYNIFIRVWKETEKRDMQVSAIMANSLELATIGVDLCAYITQLDHTHGIEDEEIAKKVKKFLTLARPK